MRMFISGYINLLKTAIGSGILTYPYLFKSYGIIFTILISLIASLLSFTGLALYIVCSNKIDGNITLSSLASSIIPKSKFFADFAICFKCFGVAISYLIIIRQLFPPVLVYIFGNQFFTQPAIALFMFLIVTAPLSYITKIDKLKYTSFCGLFCILVVILTVIYKLFHYGPVEWESVKFVTQPSILWLTGIGKLVFSFTCHQNMFTVQNEMRDSNLKKMVLLAFCTISSALVIYIIFGLFNYLIYGNIITDNILSAYPPDGLTLFVQALYVFVMGFSYPLQINPCRLYITEMLSIENTKQKGLSVISIMITTMLLASTYAIAATGIQLGVVYSVIGATASSLVCLIFPAIFYLNIGGKKNGSLQCLSWVLIVFGTMIFVSSVSNIYGKSAATKI